MKFMVLRRVEIRRQRLASPRAMIEVMGCAEKCSQLKNQLATQDSSSFNIHMKNVDKSCSHGNFARLLTGLVTRLCRVVIGIRFFVELRPSA
jgi:hypothetical protein